MYERLYGLDARPFELTPDPRFLLLTARHREALSHVEYVLSGRPGLALLLGEAGTGKTTLLRAAAQRAPSHTHVVTLDNPALTRAELFEFVADAFGLSTAAARSKTRALRALTAVLAARHEKGGVTALVVDEAQSLSDELLEEIRLLANIEASGAKLLSIILAGQPDLGRRLNDPGLAHLKQRVALRCVLTPLTLAETVDYVGSRLHRVGANLEETFTPEAVQSVFSHAMGIPRTISVICENALITGFAAGARPIGRDIIAEVCRDLDLRPASPEPSGAAEPPRPATPPAAVIDAPPAEPAAPATPAAPTVPAHRRSVLDFMPFLRFRRGGLAGALHPETRFFEVDGQRGFVITPRRPARAGRG